jgi:rubrerythrin
MGIDFNICEIFDIANELEKNRAVLFRAAAKKYRDEKVRDTLLELADYAQKNANNFTRIREGFSKADCPLTIFDPDNVDYLYLKAMAQDHVCNLDSCKNLSGNESLEEILQMAIGMKKDAIVFYTGLKNFVAEGSQKNLDFIIKEKMDHLGILNKKLNELK